MQKILDKIQKYIRENEIKDLNKKSDLVFREEEYFLFHQNRFLKILEIIKNLKKEEMNLKLLDVGSHYCHLAIGSRILGYETYGVDVGEFINATQTRSRDFKLDLRECDLSQSEIPFPDNYFDCVNFSETLEHLNFHPKDIFREFFRVLKPGGRVIITTPNLLRLNNRLKMILGKSINWDIREDYSVGTHFREYSKEEICYLLRQVNLDIEKSIYIDFDYPLNKVIKFINLVVGAFFPFLKSNIVVIGRK